MNSEKIEIGELNLQTIMKVENSSKVVRMILVFLLFACVILFIGFWNSLDFSWLNSRIKMHEYQLEWYKYISKDTIPPNLSKNNAALFYKCKDYYHKKHYTKDVLEAELEYLNDAKLNNAIFIKVPVFNVTFDVNDLGLIGGISITIIYFLLLYSLINRYNQIDNAFHLIKGIKSKEEQKSAYFLISMDQVLTLPRNIRKFKLVRLLPRTFYFYPIIILLSIFINDLATFKIGNYYLDSFWKVILVYIGSFIFLGLSIFQAFLCLRMVNKTDKLWRINYPKDQYPNPNAV